MADHNNRGTDIAFLLIAGTIIIAGIIGTVLWMRTVPGRSATENAEATAADTSAVAVADTQVGFADRFHRNRRIRLTPTPTPPEEAEDAVAEDETGPTEESSETAGAEGTGPELEAVAAVVEKGGCATCHAIPDIPNAVGVVGPDLSNIGAEAADRIEGYTAEEYLRESIIEPNAFIAPECPNNISPCPPAMILTNELSETEIDTIVNYLSTLGADEVSAAAE